MHENKWKRMSRATITFFISFFVTIIVTTAYVANITSLDQTKMVLLISTQADKVERVLEKLLYKTQALSALVIQNNGEVRDFNRTAATIVDDPSIRNILLAPNGIVTQVYPLEGNETVIGFDFFSDKEGNKEARQAKESGNLVLGGPFNMVQGGQALVGRYPVYYGNMKTDENFWGIVSVTLDFPNALNGAELDQLRFHGFAFEIWRISPDTGERQIIANSNYDYQKDAPFVEQRMDFMNAEWYFKLSPIKAWYQYPETWIFLLCGLLISLAVALLVLHNYDLNQLGRKLEEGSFQDDLTGVYNRRGLFRELDNLIDKKRKPFVLCYIDLDKFKSVNDTYGHYAGDELLKTFATVVPKHIGKKDLIARIGGDEFIIIFTNTDDKHRSSQILEHIEAELFLTEKDSMNQKIKVSFSVGIVVFPDNGKSPDELIKNADVKMYEYKTAKL